MMPTSKMPTMLAKVLTCAVALLIAPSAFADGLLVVTAANSPLTTLDKNQVRNIYLGNVGSLPDGTAAVPVDQPESSPLREEFYEKVTDRSAAEAKARWAQLAFTGRGEPPRVAGGSSEVKVILRTTPGAIGYIEKSALDGSVKVLCIVE